MAPFYIVVENWQLLDCNAAFARRKSLENYKNIIKIILYSPIKNLSFFFPETPTRGKHQKKTVIIIIMETNKNSSTARLINDAPLKKKKCPTN